TVYHRRGGATTVGQRRRRQLQARRYLLRLALKNYGRRSIVRVIVYKQKDLLSFSRDLAVALRKHEIATIKKSLDEISALFTAFFWNAVHFPIRERIIVQRSRRLSDNELELISKSSMPYGSGVSLDALQHHLIIHTRTRDLLGVQ